MECTDKYDFDTPIDRTNTQSLKWDVAENELPMWVADMDFKTAPEIIEAVNKRAKTRSIWIFNNTGKLE